MEEDIKILERLVEERELVGIYKTDEIVLQAIEYLIKAYKELEEFKKQVTEIENTNFIKYKNYIPVSLVEEKIEERKLWLSSNDIGYKDDYVLEVLQELLEKR